MRISLLVLISLLTGCAGTFNTAVRNLPSVQNCQHVVYERTGNQVKVQADCQIPMQDDSLLNIPGPV